MQTRRKNLVALFITLRCLNLDYNFTYMLAFDHNTCNMINFYLMVDFKYARITE